MEKQNTKRKRKKEKPGSRIQRRNERKTVSMLVENVPAKVHGKLIKWLPLACVRARKRLNISATYTEALKAFAETLKQQRA